VIIKIGQELGFKGKNARAKYVYTICPLCNKEKWVSMYLYKKNGDTLCKICNGRRNGQIAAKKWGVNDW
jgi:transcription elongation factor Elf1